MSLHWNPPICPSLNGLKTCFDLTQFLNLKLSHLAIVSCFLEHILVASIHFSVQSRWQLPIKMHSPGIGKHQMRKIWSLITNLQSRQGGFKRNRETWPLQWSLQNRGLMPCSGALLSSFVLLADVWRPLFM